MEPSRPKNIGDYELIELIGTGAQGRVYKGRCTASGHAHVQEGEIVAIKILSRGSGDPKDDARFKRQAEILARLTHPGICRYIDYFIDQEGEWDEKKCLVTEFLDGQSLADLIRRHPNGLPWDQVRKAFEQSIEALCYAAEQGVVHRDLKPSNIYLTKDGEAKLIDFGIAREEGGEETSTTGWKGSFDYMAPDFVLMENFRGDEQSDVFSLGVCFFMALTGSLPFPAFGENAHIGYLQRWQGGETRPTFKHGAFRVLTRVKPFVMKSLDPDRDERFRHFHEMLEEFRKIRPRMVRHKGKDDYELIEMLGRGGFGEVYKGRRASDGKFVAVKHLFAGRQSGRFIKEARLLQQYKHPDIVEYVDFIEIEGVGDDKEFFLVMEYLPGMPGAGLNARIRRSRTGIDPAEVTELFIHFLSALQYLHENPKPIIHRDIKPGNLYAPAGQPHKAKLFDLGVARDVTGTLTTGMIPGTLDYMAPEFASVGGDRGSPQSDIYAMGLSFYESLTGNKPFPRLPKADQEAFVAFVARAQNQPEVDYSHQAFQVFPQLERIVRKSIEQDPKKRYKSAGAMLAELERFLQEAIDAAGNEDVTADVETRATIADPELIARLQAHKAGRPEAIPEAALADLDAPVPGTPGSAIERPDWLEEDEGVSPPSPPATTPAPGATPSGEMPAALPARRAGPWVAIAGVVVIVLLAGALVFVVLRPRGPQSALQAPSSEKERLTAFLAEQGEPVAQESYVRNLNLMLAQARAAKLQDPGNESWWDKQIADLTDLGEALPAAFDAAFDAAFENGDLREARRIRQVWQGLDDVMPLMGITLSEYVNRTDTMGRRIGRLDFDLAVRELDELTPEQITDAETLGRAETAAGTLEVMKGRPWENITTEEQDREFGRLQTEVTDLMSGYIEGLRGEALARYTRLEDAEAQWNALSAVREAAPKLVTLTGSAYENAYAEVEQARTRSQRLAEYAGAVRGIREQMPAQVTGPAELAQAETAAQAFEQFMARTWDGVEEAQRTGVAQDIRTNLTARVGNYVQDLRGTAMDRIEDFEDPVDAWGALNAIGEEAPTAVGLLGNVYADTVREVGQARTRMQNLAGYGEAVRALRGRVPEPLEGAGQLAAANRAAEALKEFMAQRWEGVSDEDVATVAREVREPLEAYANAYVRSLREQTLQRFDTGDQTTPELDRLRALRAEAPALVELVNRDYESAITEVELAHSRLIGKSEFTTALQRAYEVLPETIRSPADLAKAEQAAQAFREIEAADWEGVSDQEKGEALNRLREGLVRRSQGYVEGLRDQAVSRYEQLENAGAVQEELQAARDTAPVIISLLGDAYDGAVAAVEAAREQRQRMVAFSEALDAVRTALPERIDDADSFARAERAAAEFADVAGRTWDGVTEARQQELLEPIRRRMIVDATTYVQTLKNSAIERYGNLEDADPTLARLREMETDAPNLVGLLGATWSDAVAATEQAQATKQNISKFAEAVRRIENALPAGALDAESVRQAELAVTAYRTVFESDWPDISPTRKREALDPIRDALVQKATNYVTGLERQALERYGELADADPLREQLAAMRQNAPGLVGMVDATYGSAMSSVDAARDAKLRRETEIRAEQERQERLRREEERLAKLRAAEEEKLAAVVSAWETIQASWEARDGANLSPQYAQLLQQAFEVPAFQERYEAIVQDFRDRIRTVFGTELANAQTAIDGFRTFLYQVADPSLSGSYRVYKEQPPSVSFSLPPMENLEDMGLGVTQARARRLQAWAETGSTLDTPEGRRALSQRLREIAAESRQAGLAEEANICEMEAVLMTSEPAIFPSALEGQEEPPEILRWRAHATYQPEVSSLDVMRDLSRYAQRAEELNEYDLRLALFASYYSWRNFIEGEGRYAQRIRDQLKEIIARADPAASGQAMDFLARYISAGPDGDLEYPGLYLVSALSLMAEDTELGRQAAAWLEQNAADARYAARLEAIDPQLRLLRRLLGA